MMGSAEEVIAKTNFALRDVRAVEIWPKSAGTLGVWQSTRLEDGSSELTCVYEHREGHAEQTRTSIKLVPKRLGIVASG